MLNLGLGVDFEKIVDVGDDGLVEINITEIERGILLFQDTDNDEFMLFKSESFADGAGAVK